MGSRHQVASDHPCTHSREPLTGHAPMVLSGPHSERKTPRPGLTWWQTQGPRRRPSVDAKIGFCMTQSRDIQYTGLRRPDLRYRFFRYLELGQKNRDLMFLDLFTGLGHFWAVWAVWAGVFAPPYTCGKKKECALFFPSPYKRPSGKTGPNGPLIHNWIFFSTITAKLPVDNLGRFFFRSGPNGPTRGQGKRNPLYSRGVTAVFDNTR